MNDKEVLENFQSKRVRKTQKFNLNELVKTAGLMKPFSKDDTTNWFLVIHRRKVFNDTIVFE